jgi:hypothetical protein
MLINTEFKTFFNKTGLLKGNNSWEEDFAEDKRLLRAIIST